MFNEDDKLEELEQTDDGQQINEPEEQDDSLIDQPDEGNQQEEDEEAPEFSLDEDGNLKWNTDEFSDSDEESEEEQPEPEEEDTNPTYTVKVDGKEVEVTQDELLRGYMRQADYTRKTQQIAEERKRLEQIYARPNFPSDRNTVPQQPMPQQNNENLNELAKQMAARNLGLDSPDDLSELDFDHINAVVEAKQALVNQRNYMMIRQRNMDNLERELRSEEPQYDAIMLQAQDEIQNLPMRQFRALQDAYEQGNPEPFRKFFHDVQKHYYSNAIKKVERKKKSTVPIVESSGNTPVTKTNVTRKRDLKSFGHLSAEEKAKKLIEWGFVDD